MCDATLSSPRFDRGSLKAIRMDPGVASGRRAAIGDSRHAGSEEGVDAEEG